MGLFLFILGVLGLILIIGAFSSFIPLVFFGGIISGGNIGFAFGLPIILMIIGAAMVYFGFYYKGSVRKSNSLILDVGKMGLLYTISIILGNYIISKLMIVNSFLAIILTSFVVSIVAEAVRSHEYHNHNFKLRWFIFYFLFYANIFWAMEKFVIPEIAFQAGFFTSIVIGFTIAGAVAIIQRINIKYHSIAWINAILLILLIVANLELIPFSGISLNIADSLNTQPIFTNSFNTSKISEDKQSCPTPLPQKLPLTKSKIALNANQLKSDLNNLIDKSIWRVEGDIRTCYQGKYKGQFPDWIYCDDMIVSRWETSSSGTINFRWYTAVSAEWKPDNDGKYSLNDFACENGKKVTVNKESTAYYVHVSRDGTEIKVEY